jgi:hypothetical protein
MSETLDEVTGLSRKTIVESKDPDARPRITLRGEDGEVLTLPTSGQPASYYLSQGSIITVNDGDTITAGEVIAKAPRETTKTKDITGGLPRVAELFEARKPKDHAIIAEIDGVVSFGKDTKGKRKLIITPEVNGEQRTDLAKEYLISKGKHISVHSGDRVRAGEPMMDGAANPHDILKVLGEKELARYLVDEVQEVYRLQGVAARHHQGLALHRVVHLGVLVPGDDEGAHRGRDQRQGGLPPWPQGERHHGPADPRRDRAAAVQAPRPRGGEPGRRDQPSRGGPRRSARRRAAPAARDCAPAARDHLQRGLSQIGGAPLRAEFQGLK